MVATIQTMWKHNAGRADIMVQKHPDWSEPSYEHFSELRSRVSGGSRRPQLARLTEAGLYRGGEDPTFGLNIDTSTPVILIEYLTKYVYFNIFHSCAPPVNAMVKLVILQKQNEHY